MVLLLVGVVHVATELSTATVLVFSTSHFQTQLSEMTSMPLAEPALNVHGRASQVPALSHGRIGRIQQIAEGDGALHSCAGACKTVRSCRASDARARSGCR